MHRRAFRKRKSHRLREEAHRIRRPHHRAGARPRTDRPLHRLKRRSGQLPPMHPGHRLPDHRGHDLPSLEVARHHRPPRDQNRGQIERRHRHHHPREDLVARSEQHQPVQPVGSREDLNGIRHDLPARQHVSHPLVPDSQSIAYRDSTELHWCTARGPDPVLHRPRESPEMDMSGMHIRA